MTTKGLGRFGLPELQVHNVPPQLGGPWTYALGGLATRLLDLWLDALRRRDGAAFAEVPAEVEVGEADVASAYDTAGRGGGHAAVRLTFDPAPGDHKDSFLRHYNGHRPHQGLQQEPPLRQPGHAVDITARIVRRQALGGLISEDRRTA